jgi:hypothetical protein
VSGDRAEWTTAERDEVFAEALHHPETAAEQAAQREKFRAWLADERYRHLWPMLERLLPAASAAGNGAAVAQPHVPT